MIQIYTTPSCSSCRKAKKWFEEHRVDYREKNIFNIRLTKDDILSMVKYSENGFEDIISTRSKIIMENDINIDEMSTSEVMDFIIDNPSVLRRPIILDNRKMQVGYNDEEIRAFMPKRLRQLIMCQSCEGNQDCDYMRALNQYFKELKVSEEAK